MLPKLYDRKKVNHESCTIIFRWPLGLKFHNICSMPAGCDFWSLIAVASLKRATAPLQVQPFQSSTQVVPCRKSVHFDPSMKSSIFEKSLLNGPIFPHFPPDRGESCRRLWRLNKIDFPRCHFKDFSCRHFLHREIPSFRFSAGVVHHWGCGGTLSSHAGNRLSQRWWGEPRPP